MILIEDFEKEHCTCPGKTYLAKNSEGKVLGRMCIRGVSWFGKEFCHLFVNEDYRRKGVATFLSDELKKLTRGFIITGTIQKNNTIAHHSTESHGFEFVRDFKSILTDNMVSLFIFDNTKR